MKFLALFFSVCSFSILHADATLQDYNSTKKKPAYDVAFPLQDGSISLNGEFLWWKPYARIPYAVTSIPITYGQLSTTNAVNNERLQQVNLKFHPGLRVQVGLYMPVPTWKLYWTYTRFNSSARRLSVPDTSGGETLVPIWETVNIFSSEPFPQTLADAKQMLNYNIFDWDIVNYLSWGKHFIFIPWWGLRVAYIKNDLTVIYSGQNVSPNAPVRDKVSLENHFRGFGLKGGFWIHYSLTKNWELFGNTFLSTLLSRITTRQKENFVLINPENATHVGTIGNANRFLSVKTAFDLAIGISWNMRFGLEENRLIGFYASYEAHIWPDQIQYTRFRNTNVTSTGGSPPNPLNPVDFYKSDLSFQGFAFRAKLEF